MTPDVIADDIAQIGAEFAERREICIQFRGGHGEVGSHRFAGQENKRNIGIEQHARGIEVLEEVEFACLWPVGCMSAKPNDRDLFRNFRFEKAMPMRCW